MARLLSPEPLPAHAGQADALSGRKEEASGPEKDRGQKEVAETGNRASAPAPASTGKVHGLNR
jgi:hypothetical protein